MARNYWNVYKKVAGVWTADGSIAVPNDDLVITKRSPQRKVELAEGENAFFTPSNDYNFERINFVWYGDDGTIKTKVDGYITNRTDVKIIDDNADEYIGRFIDFQSTRVKGITDMEYDIKAVFEIMPRLA